MPRRQKTFFSVVVSSGELDVYERHFSKCSTKHQLQTTTSLFLKKEKKHRKQIYYVVSALLLLLLQKDKFSQILKKMGAMLLVGGIIRPSTGILQGTFMHNIYNMIPWGK